MKDQDGTSQSGTFPETADIETSSDTYAERFAGSTGEWMLRVQETIALSLLKSRGAATVLDVGGGHGQLAMPLCREKFRVTVLSSSESCRRRIAQVVNTGQCTFQVGNVIELPFQDRSFDSVICFRLVTHCAQWHQLIRELCRVARHSVIIDYPTSQSFNKMAPWLFRAKRKLEGDTRTFNLFRHDDIEKEFKKYGYNVYRRTGEFFLPMVLHRILKCRPLSACVEAVLTKTGLTRRWGSPVIVEMVRRNKALFSTCSPPCKIPRETKVLVTGATGFTGSVLVRKLVNAGLDVHAITRSSSKLDHLGDLNIRWFRGDVFDEPTVTAASNGVEYIFHVASAYREAKYADEMYSKVHLTSTQLLAKAALQNPNFKRFVHVSTVGVHGHIANPPADENYPMHPGDVYQKTKAEAELWLRDFASGHSLPFTVIRPTGIYGPGDMRLLKFFKMASRRILFLLGRGQCLYHLIHVDDLTNAMILAATHPAALNEVFICGAPDYISLEQIARIVARELGSDFRVMRLPAGPLFLAADLCERVCRTLGIEPPIHRRRLAFFTKDRAFNTQKLREQLGYHPLYSNEEGLIQTTRWYCDQGWLKKRQP